MRPNRALEIGTGLFVLLGFAALFFLTTQLPGSGLSLGGVTGYRLTAKFDNVGDLKTGSPVSMAGVTIGRVESVGFDPNEFRAVVTMRIDTRFDQIPEDSDASIQTQGLLGGKYVGIGPGGSETYLKDGDQIEFTQSAIVLESLVNKFFANFAGRAGESKQDDSTSESSKEGSP
ncbi:MAG: outer membrane lipid asymmetry maintenance protein MlaD [Steroidobacteraceae bacterium]|nr:outer membrane lipid asymmetry maintenance protein MlaD [Nevskiaceae bacterium]